MVPVYSVSQFMAEINGIIAGQFIVEGEISQFKVNQGKWVFFDLKDETSVLGCFAVLYKLKVPLQDGMRVRITGYPKIYEKNSRLSFTVDKVELVGEGALKQAYELLKKKLAAEGLFDPGRKRKIPRIPNRIGVIASGESAAWGDFKRILTNRWGGVEVMLRHVAVQGASAVQEITDAFRDFNEQADFFDVLVLIRGGGSLEDLAAFNSEEVARAVYGSRIPVVCGVGHERDESLADFVADVRASTPSNAAELVVPDKKDFIQELSYELEQMERVLSHSIMMRKQQVSTLFFRMQSRLEAPLVSVKHTIEAFKQMTSVLERRITTYKEFVNSAERLFKNIDPRRVLQRGYSITRTKSGKIVRSADELDRGETIMVELGRGSVTGNIIDKA